MEIRAVIKYMHLKGLSPIEIHDDMVQTLGEDAPSYFTVENWYANFRHRIHSTEVEACPGRLSEVVTIRNVDAVLDSVMLDHRLTTRQLATVHSISKTSVERILHEHLNMNKVSERWVPQMLMTDQKRCRAQEYRELLGEFSKNKEDFLAHIVTQDRIWVHYFDSETKSQSIC